MAMALAGYMGTMVAALTVLMMLWNSVIGPPSAEKLFQPRHAIVAVQEEAQPQNAAMRTAARDEVSGRWGPAVIHRGSEDADAAEAAQTRLIEAKLAAEKAKRVAAARQQKRKWLAQRQQAIQEARAQQDSTARDSAPALGYAQEAQQEPQPQRVPFNILASRRF